MKQEADFFNGLLLFVFSGMHVAIHRSLEIRLTEDALNGFHIRSSVIEHGSHRMPEDMCCSTMKINCAMDAIHHAAKCLESHWRFGICPKYNVSCFFIRGEERQKFIQNGNCAISAVGLWGSDLYIWIPATFLTSSCLQSL